MVVEGVEELDRGKLQVLRQGRKIEVKELRNTDVDVLLIKIAKIGGFRVWVNARVLSQRMYTVLYTFCSEDRLQK